MDTEVYGNGPITRNIRPRPTVPLPLLLKHMEAHYTEYQLRNDIDCITVLCETESDAAEVRKFAKAKLRGKSYSGSAAVVDALTCEGCGKGFHAKRSDAKYCSPSCRQRSGRRENRGSLSQISS